MAMSVAEEIILCVGYAIIFIANIVGNTFVCAVVLVLVGHVVPGVVVWPCLMGWCFT